MHHSVFISYARKDYMDDHNRIIPNNIVSRVQDALRDAGISYWIDEEGLQAGDTFPVKIAQQIEHCQVFLFISTENSNQSPWVVNEIATAHHYGKPIIPLRYDLSPYNPGIMLYIASLQYIDYSANPKTVIADLMAAVQSAMEPSIKEYCPKAIAANKRSLKPYPRYLFIALAVLIVAAAAFFGIYELKNHVANISPEATIEGVFITAHGECFHTDSTCHTIRQKKHFTISLEEAQELSKRPCSFCVKQE